MQNRLVSSMTIYGLIASTIWAAIAVLFIARAQESFNRWLTVTDPLSRAEKTKPLQIPDDLMALALGETEKWAQDSTVEAIRERYDKYKNWNQVRTSMGVALKDGEG